MLFISFLLRCSSSHTNKSAGKKSMSRTYEDDVAPAQYLQETGASDVKFARMMLPHTASLWQSLDDNTVCCKQTCVRVRLRLCVCVCVWWPTERGKVQLLPLPRPHTFRCQSWPPPCWKPSHPSVSEELCSVKLKGQAT